MLFVENSKYMEYYFVIRNYFCGVKKLRHYKCEIFILKITRTLELLCQIFKTFSREYKRKD